MIPLDKVHDMWQGNIQVVYTYIVTMTMTYMTS